MGNTLEQRFTPTSQIAQEFLNQTEKIYQDLRKNAMQAYIKYKAYNNKKAKTSKLSNADYVDILQQKAYHQRSNIPSSDFRRIGPYIFEKALPNNSYLIRKVGTNKTQLLHCACVFFDSSHPDNSCRMCKSHLRNGTMIRS